VLELEENREYRHGHYEMESMYADVTCELSIREGRHCTCRRFGSFEFPNECGAQAYKDLIPDGAGTVKRCCPKKFQFFCEKTKLCLPESYKCDFDNDCGNWEDEDEKICPFSSAKVTPNAHGLLWIYPHFSYPWQLYK
jgi:hypothetical protein